ncbi:major facilitator superfamily domain-containing protein [Blakeslea trispora]|nr:major facilitator superfamily domain-containing protein [Blakeslea trispora]
MLRSLVAKLPERAYITSFVIALAVANVSGPQYIYPTFGTSLVDRLHWNGIENSMVGTATFVGVSFSGPLCAWLIETLLFKKTLMLSSFTGLVGFLLLAQTYAGHLPSNYILCSIYLALIGAAGAASYLCALDSQAHNFKSSRGMSMGITSAALGISGLVFSQINDKFFKEEALNDGKDDSTYDFLIFIAFAVAFTNLLGSYILGPINKDEEVDIATDSREIGIEQQSYTQSISSFSSTSTRIDEEARGEQRPLLSKNVIVSVDNASMMMNDGQKLQRTTSESLGDVSGLALFKNLVGLSIASALLIILGIGYVYLANVGQLVISVSSKNMKLSQVQHLRNLHVSIFSVSNCASRALFGVLSDVLQKKAGVHRLWFFWTACLGLILSLIYLVTSVTTADALIPCTVLIAVVYGITFGLAPAIVSEFGTKTFARNWGWLLCAPAIGSQTFNFLFGSFYELESKRQGNDSVCYGPDCFKMTFTIGIVSAFICLIVLSWTVYKKELYKKS